MIFYTWFTGNYSHSTDLLCLLLLIKKPFSKVELFLKKGMLFASAFLKHFFNSCPKIKKRCSKILRGCAANFFLKKGGSMSWIFIQQEKVLTSTVYAKISDVLYHFLNFWKHNHQENKHTYDTTSTVSGAVGKDDMQWLFLYSASIQHTIWLDFGFLVFEIRILISVALLSWIHICYKESFWFASGCWENSQRWYDEVMTYRYNPVSRSWHIWF